MTASRQSVYGTRILESFGWIGIDRGVGVAGPSLVHGIRGNRWLPGALGQAMGFLGLTDPRS